MSEPIRLWKEHDAMAAIVNGVKSPQFTLDRRALEDFAYPDEEYAALPAAEFAALSARVAKLEAEQSEARKRAARLEAALRDAVDSLHDAERSLRDAADEVEDDAAAIDYHDAAELAEDAADEARAAIRARGAKS